MKREFIPSLIRRHLRMLPAFTVGEAGLPPDAISLEDGEVIVGWYESPAPWESVVGIFTDVRIRWIDESVVHDVRYERIVGYVLPTPKMTSTTVAVDTDDGRVELRVTGRNGEGGKYPDTYALVQILHAFRDARARAARKT